MPHSRLRARARARDAAKHAAAAAASSASSNILKRSCYTLAESVQFENNPTIRIVYMTEKGVDLRAVDPDFAMIDYANRNGYSWYNILHTPPPAITNAMQSNKHICVVHTTEAELVAHRAPNHKANIIAQIDALPRIEYTMDRIVNIITEYLYANNITDFNIADQVCEIACSRGLYEPASAPVSPHHESDSDDSQQTIECDANHEVTDTYSAIYSDVVNTMGYLPGWTIDWMCQTFEAFALAILPIPVEME